MRSQVIPDITANTVYRCETVNLPGTRYVITNKSPYLIYVTDQAVVSVDSARSSMITSIDPMDTKSIGAVNANNLTVATAPNIGISIGSQTGTFISITAVAVNEEIETISSAGAFSTYNASAVDNALGITTINITPTVFGQQNLGPIDLEQWAGIYFAWNPPSTGYIGFLRVEIMFSPDNILYTTARGVMGSAGYIASPKVARYCMIRLRGFNFDAGSTTATVWGVSARRVTEPIDPVVSLAEDTLGIFQNLVLLPGFNGTYNLPANGGQNRIGIYAAGMTVPSLVKISQGLAVNAFVEQTILAVNNQTYKYILPADEFTPIVVQFAFNADNRTIGLYYWTQDRGDV